MFEHAFYASWGRIPRLTQIKIQENLLHVHPETKGTGTVHVPIAHPKYGIMLRSTETLQQRTKPYHLLKELGRGELGRMLRLLYEWRMLGFVPSDALRREIHDMIHSFGIMATSNDMASQTDQVARELFDHLSSMGTHLVDQYFEQMIATRQKKHPRFPVPLGIFLRRNAADNSLDSIQTLLRDESIRTVFDEAFQLIAATPAWNEVEITPGKYRWDVVERFFALTEKLGKKPLVGPILSFKPSSLPAWIREKIDDREAFENAAVRYTTEFVKRFHDRGSHWIVSSDFFSCPECGFSIGRGVALICDLIREVKYSIDNGAVLVGIDQPCGDYYRTNDCPLPFIAIAESLASVRSLDGFLLDINIGMGRQDTLPRDPMLLSRLVDLWSIWGKKLYVSLAVPNRWEVFQENRTDDWQMQVQLEWTVRMILMCLTKRNIHGIFWNQLLDNSESLPVGLIGADGRMKPTFQKIAALRQTFLEPGHGR